MNPLLRGGRSGFIRDFSWFIADESAPTAVPLIRAGDLVAESAQQQSVSIPFSQHSLSVFYGNFQSPAFYFFEKLVQGL